MYALNLDENDRVMSATFEKYAAPGMPLVDCLPWERYPADTPQGEITNYRWKIESWEFVEDEKGGHEEHIPGGYIFDPLPEPEEPPTEPTPTLDERVGTLEAGQAELTETISILLSGATK